MIVTVTPNPSIDRTIQIDRLERGGLIRAGAANSEAAGKGLNVSRALVGQGFETLAVLPVARETASTYLGLLADEVPVAAVSVAGSVRVNISLVEPDGTVTKVNEPGPRLENPEVDAILVAIASAPPADWIVGCGSLPPGAPIDFYARLSELGSADRRIAINSSGEALSAATRAGIALVKPNLSELGAIAGRPLASLGDAVDAARDLVTRGVGAVLLSLGEDGAIFVDGAGAASHAEAAIEDAANSVGAGDALLAGFLAAGAEFGGIGRGRRLVGGGRSLPGDADADGHGRRSGAGRRPRPRRSRQAATIVTSENADMRVVISGTPGAPGIAQGPWVRYEPATARLGGRVSREAVELEVARLVGAAEFVAAASEQLADEVRQAGHAGEAEIFSAHAAMARDPELVETAAGHIRNELMDGPAAISAAAQAVAELLRGLGDELLRARATDVLDVGDRIARQLAGLAPGGVSLVAPSIVVADDLPPSVTATLPRERVLGIALEGSSPTAHASILARAYGIPAVVGASGLLAAVAGADPHAELLIDGSSGEVIVRPNPDDAVLFAAVSERIEHERERDRADAHLPAETTDGVSISLLANIGSPGESENAVALGARGVGLFRTEFLFLERTDPPSEEEQLEAYGQVAEAFAPHGVTVRLLDVGGDKPIPYLPLAPEDNPFLGVRALRLAETQPDLFVTQLRACYRAASRGRIKVMAPMVADARDTATLLALAERARAEAVAAGHPVGDVELGVMLEIPSAVLTAETYFHEIRFASLGTNDLLQYTLAVDRGNPALERYRDALHPALLRLVALAVDAGARFGIEISVCGEMAGDPAAALALVGLGVRSLSMTASSLPRVRGAIRARSLAELQAAAADGLAAGSAAAVRSSFEALLAAAT